jgi:hypothetical protein
MDHLSKPEQALTAQHLETKLNVAFKKSGMHATDFVNHLLSIRPNNTALVEYTDWELQGDHRVLEFIAFKIDDSNPDYNGEYTGQSDWYNYFSFVCEDGEEFQCTIVDRNKGVEIFGHQDIQEDQLALELEEHY